MPLVVLLLLCDIYRLPPRVAGRHSAPRQRRPGSAEAKLRHQPGQLFTGCTTSFRRPTSSGYLELMRCSTAGRQWCVTGAGAPLADRIPIHLRGYPIPPPLQSGTIIAQSYVTLDTGATLIGAGLAMNGAIILHSADVTLARSSITNTFTLSVSTTASASTSETPTQVVTPTQTLSTGASPSQTRTQSRSASYTPTQVSSLRCTVSPSPLGNGALGAHPMQSMQRNASSSQVVSRGHRDGWAPGNGLEKQLLTFHLTSMRCRLQPPLLTRHMGLLQSPRVSSSPSCLRLSSPCKRRQKSSHFIVITMRQQGAASKLKFYVKLCNMGQFQDLPYVASGQIMTRGTRIFVLRFKLPRLRP